MTGPRWPSPRPTLIDHARLLDRITAEGELLVQSAAVADLAAPVPGCPGLTVGETVRHTGSVYHQVLAWIRYGEPPDHWRRGPDGDHFDDLVKFHVEARSALVSELAEHPPDEPCATWWPVDQSYGFWWRRMAHETAVHRIDVQAASSLTPSAVTVEFAADGIDEVLLLWFGERLARLGMTATAQGAVGIETAGRAWLAILDQVRSSARRVPPGDARAADALVAGDPLSVYLWLWGRVPDRAVTISGDIDASAQLWALLRTATQ